MTKHFKTLPQKPQSVTLAARASGQKTSKRRFKIHCSWCGTMVYRHYAQNESEAYNLGRRRQTYDCLQAFNWKRLTLILRFFCGFLLTSGELLDVVQFLSEWRLTPPHSSSLPLGSRECAPSVSGTVSDGASSPLSSS